ncbi:hypothetical protein DFH07DRAFT_948045 [Mycena maculata]|uniref:Uncharacterized protein n=1 Tax=Mycena maculata TaxID=230809 RepID=A0AAD7P279_9AGAR|nr:hypothetical protein DFH07DRAFT_948045 [Mycena maculata]
MRLCTNCREAKLKNKFKALGYQDPELDGLDSHKVLVQFKHPLTKDAWAVMRESLEGPIRDKRRSRLLKEHSDIVKARQILAQEVFLAYAATVLPREATFLPTLAGLEAIPEIRSICEHEPNVDGKQIRRFAGCLKELFNERVDRAIKQTDGSFRTNFRVITQLDMADSHTGDNPKHHRLKLILALTHLVMGGKIARRIVGEVFSECFQS